jgi:hypothetical protein
MFKKIISFKYEERKGFFKRKVQQYFKVKQKKYCENLENYKARSSVIDTVQVILLGQDKSRQVKPSQVMLRPMVSRPVYLTSLTRNRIIMTFITKD